MSTALEPAPRTLDAMTVDAQPLPSSSRRRGPARLGLITFDPAALERRVAELEGRWARPASGTTSRRGAQVSAEHAGARDAARALRRELRARARRTLAELLARTASMADEIADVDRCRSRAQLERLEEDALFSGEHDAGDAVVTINAGEGGTDAQDWAEMLLRMYLRWADGAASRPTLKEIQGEEAGIKSRDVHGRAARTPTGCCRPSAACTGWCACARSTRRTGGRRPSRRWTSPRWSPTTWTSRSSTRT